MRYFIRITACILFFLFWVFSFESIANENIDVEGISSYEILIKKSGIVRRCMTDQISGDIKLSSDEKSVIVSGTSFIPVRDLLQCDPEKIIHVRRAAPHVGFLSDVNLRMGLYASLVPVTVNPMSFLAVVAKIGSDKNIINLPGFFRIGMRKSRILREASSSMSPVISLDGHYISLDLYGCGSEGGVDVFDIKLNKMVHIDHASCEKLFRFQ